MSFAKRSSPPPLPQLFLLLWSTFFLLLNKLRHSLKGYTTPRPFSIQHTNKAVSYDLHVIENWLSYLQEYTKNEDPFRNKNILEIGPGADLGIGVTLLHKGAESYHALDAHHLIESTPLQFYQALFDELEKQSPQKINRHYWLEQIKKTLAHQPEKINHLVDPTFNLPIFKPKNINLVVSQAAFEHIPDVERMIKELSATVLPGTILVAEVDLQTHTRWLREMDPLSIYRHSDWFYNLCAFSGSPNRLRAYEYEHVLHTFGWHNIQIIPTSVVHKTYLDRTLSHLNNRFQTSQNKMEILGFMLLATKN